MPKEENDLDRAIKASAAVVSLVREAADSSSGKVALENIGKSAVTITSAVNNSLLPLAAINFAFEKAKIYFAERFQNDLENAAKAIPEKNLVEPSPSVAGPILQGLAYSHDQETIRGMYLSLLANSMNAEFPMLAHPGFASVLQQITPFDAEVLNSLLAEQKTPIARTALVNPDYDATGEPLFIVPVDQHLLNMVDSDTGYISEDQRIGLTVSNICRLGVASANYSRPFRDNEHYHWMHFHPAYAELWSRGDEGIIFSNDGSQKYRVAIQPGVLVLTPFGEAFAMAIGLRERLQVSNEV